MCGCRQRGEALKAAAAAVVRGDIASLKIKSAYVIRSSAQDLAQMAKRAAAHARLKRA